MQTKYSTSTNILRDSSKSLSYIPTPNALRAVSQIANDFKKGLRSFNIIGSYGTGKSTFLWALHQSITGKRRYFNLNVPFDKVRMIEFVGEYRSMISVFAEYFDINIKKEPYENIFAELFSLYKATSKKDPMLVIVIDEFGKFLEFAANNEPEKELYFIQQFAEFVNNSECKIALITTIHQSFDAYSFSLQVPQRQEWTKVKGRFREITFNEPVEQLLFLASEHLKKPHLDKAKSLAIKQAAGLLTKSKAFKINPGYISEISAKLFPLDLFAANVLTLLLQKYGQNERSLFSFLESTDHTGIKRYDDKSNPFFNISNVYDYFIFNFYAHLNSRYNPDFSIWNSVKTAIEKIEQIDDSADCYKLVKTIGLLNITAAAGAPLDENFLIKYSELCLGIKNGKQAINQLIKHKIIGFKYFLNRFVILDGTDLDIPLALIEAGNKLSEIQDISTRLNRHFEFPQVLAKSHSYQRGTSRVFEFKISSSPIDIVPEGEVDGYINLLFADNFDRATFVEETRDQQEAIVYAVYTNTRFIKTQLFEIEKTLRVLEENDHDRAAVRELEQIHLHQKNLLTHFILNNLYRQTQDVIWLYHGEQVEINSKRELNQFLSLVCDGIYFNTPVFKNELVNRHKISSSAHTAKRNYFKALVDGWDKPDLGFEKDKFPPEKTIYLTLLKENGIKLFSENDEPVTRVKRNSSFVPLWQYSINFLSTTKVSKRKISEFVEPLTKRPFKLKQGFIDFWVSSFFFIKRDEFALFGESGAFIPYINDEVLELLVKYPHKYEIKAFNIEGIKLDVFNSYRTFLNQRSRERVSNQSFIETIKPFLTFYHSLPEYSRNTTRLTKDTIALRQAISRSKDPEQSFFEDFPAALGFNIDQLRTSKKELGEYITNLQASIRELRTSYDNLLERFEEYILEEFIGEKVSYEAYRTTLRNRYGSLKKHLCLPHQRVFLQRLDSEIPDKKAWLSSIGNSLIGKSLESISDEEEMLLYDRFSAMVGELDSLNTLSKEEFDHEKEDLLGIELSSFIDGINKSSIRLPKTKVTEVSKIEDTIRRSLSKNDSLNITALAHILKDLLKK